MQGSLFDENDNENRAASFTEWSGGFTPATPAAKVPMTRAGHAGPNPPRYRNGGAETSRLAAESLSEDTIGRRCAEVLRVIVAAGDNGANCDEVCVALDQLENKPSISRRITDLAEAGRVRLNGTRPGRAGRSQQVWVAA